MPFYGQAEYLDTFASFRSKTSLQRMYAALPTLQQKKITLVDVMAGTGIVGRTLAQSIRRNRRKIVNVISVDDSEEMLAHRSYKPGDCRILADVTDIPLDENFADVVTCRIGLNNLPRKKWEPAIHEMLRITRKDGMLILQDHFPLSRQEQKEMEAIERLIAWMESRSAQPSIRTLDETTKLISKVGGAVVSRSTFEHPFELGTRLEANMLFTSCIRKSYLSYPISTLGVTKNEQNEG